MHPKILEIAAKYKVKMFDLFLDDLFTYVFETDKKVPDEALIEIKEAIATHCTVVNRLIPKVRKPRKANA